MKHLIAIHKLTGKKIYAIDKGYKEIPSWRPWFNMVDGKSNDCVMVCEEKNRENLGYKLI